MTDKTMNILNFATNIFVILYFLILAAERTQSLVRAGSKKLLFTDGIHNYMAGLCLFSFLGTAVLWMAKAIYMSRLTQGEVTHSGDVANYAALQLILLCAAVGCMLLSGMVHTEYSIPGIQFGAYGALILAMLLRVIVQQDILTSGRRALALLYVVAFSMAIPVVYPSEVKYRLTFHITESIVSFVMVVLFSVMLYALFAGQYAVIFHPAFIVTALIGDILVLALRWQEKINWFVLISLAVALLTWICCVLFDIPCKKG